MNQYERLYDETEQVNVRFIGFVSEHGRYDFGIIYTQMFFGKPLVVSMQTGRSSLLSQDDIENLEDLQRVYNLRSRNEAEEVATFLRHNIPSFILESEAELG
ncbi:Protein of unknown function (DUF3055) [Melghirimyces profundicolus]|uniref:DUF3055 family protein n=1 Tax=Melghirimyces profundicolus TaxID=1242148 RepID=A0A2T6C9P8_9BACL|nr:DUF3055 domain-containing protein [Melghirimyces profundicolus]PTX65055.1 Protein of unknown function (DUF3055) [Melghirimyces profundicolus]